MGTLWTHHQIREVVVLELLEAMEANWKALADGDCANGVVRAFVLHLAVDVCSGGPAVGLAVVLVPTIRQLNRIPTC